MITVRSRAVIAAATLTVLGAASIGAWADTSSTVPVTTSVLAGTRTLNVTDPAGTNIGTSGLPLGVGHGGSFLVNVLDTNYQHAGYQVSATMTNLYRLASGSPDFNGTPIPSSAVSVGYPSNLLDLLDVQSLVTPVVQLTGALNLPLLSAVNVSQTVNGLTQSVQSLTDPVTKATLSSVLNQLPVTLNTGEVGAFTSPASYPGDGTSNASPTSKVLMSGTAQQPLTSALVAAINSTLGGLTAQQLITAGLLDQNTVLQAAATALGVPTNLLTSTDITTILTTLTGTVTGLTGNLLGQSGSYTTMPALSINVPSGVTTGTYQGQMVVTLMDN